MSKGKRPGEDGRLARDTGAPGRLGLRAGPWGRLALSSHSSFAREVPCLGGSVSGRAKSFFEDVANSGDLVLFQHGVGRPLDGSIMMVMIMLLKKRMVMLSAVVALETVAIFGVLDADARGDAVRGPPRRLDTSARERRRLPSRGGVSPPRPRILSASLSEPAAARVA